MERLVITPPEGNVAKGEVTLNGSKSIANRVQVIRALCAEKFEIENLSNADDTLTLERLLQSEGFLLDAGAGGTTYRFLTAYLSALEGQTHLLTGSARMLERPIGILVRALRQLGADITCTEKDGYPPLLIKGKQLTGTVIEIPADTSSQYISALLMIGPVLSGGLTLELKGEVVSRPYIEMTLKVMAYFGAEYSFSENTIRVEEGEYRARPFFVEADWSAASYYYAIAALSDSADITLKGLSEESLQGDAVIADIMRNFGVSTTYTDRAIRIVKDPDRPLPERFDYDFVACPDLAQTVVVVCAALGVPGKFRGLQTLLIKETDRVAALGKELGKYGAVFQLTGDGVWALEPGKWPTKATQEIDTYDDHRMAMAFAPLCLKAGSVCINEPGVVSKSYPAYWEDLASLGFVCR